MKIGILGTGMVGRTLAAGFAGAGHSVVIGTRDLRGKQVPQGAHLASLGEACDADLVINALNGQGSLPVLQDLRDRLAGTVLLDLANPLDFSAGFPPTLFTDQTDSLGEQIQRALPDTRVVKSLNTLTADLMLNPRELPTPTAVFVCGDDAVAKQLVRDVLTAFGWEQIIDLGGIAAARGAEMLMPMWLQLMQTFGDARFNWAIVR